MRLLQLQSCCGGCRSNAFVNVPSKLALNKPWFRTAVEQCQQRYVLPSYPSQVGYACPLPASCYTLSRPDGQMRSLSRTACLSRCRDTLFRSSASCSTIFSRSGMLLLSCTLRGFVMRRRSSTAMPRWQLCLKICVAAPQRKGKAPM